MKGLMQSDLVNVEEIENINETKLQESHDLQNMDFQEDLFDVDSLIKANKPLKKTSHYEEKFVFTDKDELDVILEDTSSTTRGKLQDEFSQEYLSESLAFQKAKEEQEKKDHHNRVLEARKTMELKDYPDPKNDNEKLMHLQYLFLKSGDKTDWWNLMCFAEKITKRLVWHFMRLKNIPLDKISQDEKVGIAIEYTMRRYEDTVGYYVKTNYISFLKGGVRHAFDYYNKTDQELLLGDKTINLHKEKGE